MTLPPTLVRDWTYQPSKPSALVRLMRLRSQARGWKPPPAWQVIRPIEPAQRWNMLFLYAPDGRLRAGQQDSLARLRNLRGRSAVVFASASPSDLPDVVDGADALYWKGLSGFDFSAYAFMLQEVARHSPGADLYLQNDSVLGPFGDIDSLIEAAPWRLTGFLGSSAMENHLQSYALLFRGVDLELVEALEPVLSSRRALDSWKDVVCRQETRLARTASRSGCSVGALWFAPGAHEAETPLLGAAAMKAGLVRRAEQKVADPSLCNAADLIEEGFPFLKRSLFGRNQRFQERRRLERLLSLQGLSPEGVL